MKACVKFLSRQLLALLLCVSVAFAQTTPSVSDQPVFTQQELDQMLAPIALYPDSLLSQILMASTYPLEIVQAARWSKAHPNLTGDEAVKAVEQNNWDPSVKSLVAFPQILAMLDERLDWTERLGDAFLSQQQQVMDTVQDLRQKALAAGNLKTNEYVRVEPQEQIVIVEHAHPEVIYVPYYDPYVVYGPWWWPAYPPVYWGPWPGYYQRAGVGAGFWWGAGVTVGVGFFFGAFDWPHRHASVVNVHNYYYRPSPQVQYGPRGGWRHDPGHRRGVPYRDPVLRQQYNRYDARLDARREYRGNESYRWQAPGTRGDRPEARNVPGRPTNRDRARPGTDGRIWPNVPEAGRPERRAAPTRPSVDTAPSRPSVPDARDRDAHRFQARPPAPITPSRPTVEARPHVFEGVGRGASVRDSSVRGRSSSERAAPERPAARSQGAVPVPRNGGSATPHRPSGGSRGTSAPPFERQR